MTTPNHDSARQDLARRDAEEHALAEAETALVRHLETSTPPRDASAFHITEAARAFHAEHGSWDVSAVDRDALDTLLARHAR